ncbi:MAG: hypothetical protein N2559_05870 [Anaerolineae bacterium]|nr:hypothetical protein [Anaerolineae bacterium]
MKKSTKRSTKETRATYRAARRPSLQRLVRALRAADPDIIEIVQFGSSVYAPRLARDVDLFVLTRAKKDYSVYLDAVADYRKNVDIVPKEPGESIGADIALALVTWSRTLYGDGQTRQEALKAMAVPTFDQATKLLTAADRDLERANQESDPFYRDLDYRSAFNRLFDAARYASMAFLATEETRWGYLPKKLPAPFNARFREFITTLHVKFSYDGKYPRDRVDETFAEWRGKVSAFIDALETYTHQDKQ